MTTCRFLIHFCWVNHQHKFKLKQSLSKKEEHSTMSLNSNNKFSTQQRSFFQKFSMCMRTTFRPVSVPKLSRLLTNWSCFSTKNFWTTSLSPIASPNSLTRTYGRTSSPPLSSQCRWLRSWWKVTPKTTRFPSSEKESPLSSSRSRPWKTWKKWRESHSLRPTPTSTNTKRCLTRQSLCLPKAPAGVQTALVPLTSICISSKRSKSTWS